MITTNSLLVHARTLDTQFRTNDTDLNHTNVVHITIRVQQINFYKEVSTILNARTLDTEFRINDTDLNHADVVHTTVRVQQINFYKELPLRAPHPLLLLSLKPYISCRFPQIEAHLCLSLSFRSYCIRSILRSSFAILWGLHISWITSLVSASV
ncbi:hypothetical protein F0562_009176 [Nyssa sinensis]|uniref:Uncharacterized protein n=1 Tax=Nyssa sinensis TaxID=561372 RepID=A0A5J4ZZ22_9ASTE|nr:hypothetical protein F0562_009176 [Nyssa sinensis]